MEHLLKRSLLPRTALHPIRLPLLQWLHQTRPSLHRTHHLALLSKHNATTTQAPTLSSILNHAYHLYSHSNSASPSLHSRTPRHFTTNLTPQRYTSELHFPSTISCDAIHHFRKAFTVHGAWRGGPLIYCILIDSLPILPFRLIPNTHSLLVLAFLEVRIWQGVGAGLLFTHAHMHMVR